LNNWAICALAIEATNDAITAAAAALRIGIDDKAIHRLCKALCYLGEHELAILVLDLFEKSGSLQTLYDDARKAKTILSSFQYIDPYILGKDPPSLLANWIGPVETYMTKDKGRGLRATRDIQSGEVVLIDRAIAAAEFNVGQNDSFVTSITTGYKVDATATVKLKLALVNRTQRDGILNRIVSRLADGTKSKPLVPLPGLMRTLNCCPLLLPGLYDYLEDEGPKLSTETVHSTVSVNIHGIEGEGEGDCLDGSQLFSLVSTMNHSSHPNCSFFQPDKIEMNVVIVTTTRPIQKDEELSMKYHEDEKTAAAHWKFSAS
jgi:hypothetical protein